MDCDLKNVQFKEEFYDVCILQTIGPASKRPDETTTLYNIALYCPIFSAIYTEYPAECSWKIGRC